MSAKLQITDVTARDGHQSLFATRARTEDLLPILAELDKVGYETLETWGGATFDVCIRFLNEDPWERLRRFKEAAPNTRQQMLLRGQNLTGYTQFPDNVVREYVRAASENGVNVFRVFDALNDMRNLATAINELQAIKREGADVEIQGTICYTTGPVFTTDYYVAKAQELKALGCDSICIKDMAGLLTVKEMEEIARSIKGTVGLPLVLHMHAGLGRSEAVLKQAPYYFDRVDFASHGMSGGPGHSNIDIIRNHEDPEVREAVAGFDWDAYDRAAELAYTESLKQTCAGNGSKYNPDLMKHLRAAGVPGGMQSNFESQLREQLRGRNVSYEKALTDILLLIPTVRNRMGWPPLVTPTSQIVVTQAVKTYLEDVLKGRELMTSLTVQAQELLAGKYGALPADPDPELVARSCAKLGMDGPITERPADLLEPYDFDALKEKLLAQGIDSERLTRENLLTAVMWGHMGEDFVLGKGWHQNEEPLQTPSFASNRTGMKLHTGFMGAWQVVDALGGANEIYKLVLAGIEKARCTDDGVYEGLTFEERRDKKDAANAFIDSFYEGLAEKLEKGGIKRELHVSAVYTLDMIVGRLATNMGLRDAYIPKVPANAIRTIEMPDLKGLADKRVAARQDVYTRMGRDFAVGDWQVVAAIGGDVALQELAKAYLEIARVNGGYYNTEGPEERGEREAAAKAHIETFYRGLGGMLGAAGIDDVHCYSASHAVNRMVRAICKQQHQMKDSELPELPKCVRAEKMPPLKMLADAKKDGEGQEGYAVQRLAMG